MYQEYAISTVYAVILLCQSGFFLEEELVDILLFTLFKAALCAWQQGVDLKCLMLSDVNLSYSRYLGYYNTGIKESQTAL